MGYSNNKRIFELEEENRKLRESIEIKEESIAYLHDLIERENEKKVRKKNATALLISSYMLITIFVFMLIAYARGYEEISFYLAAITIAFIVLTVCFISMEFVFLIRDINICAGNNTKIVVKDVKNSDV